MEDQELTGGTESENITDPVIESKEAPGIDPDYFFCPSRHEGEDYDAYHWRRKLANRIVKLGLQGRLEGQVISFEEHRRLNAQKEN